MFVLGGHVEINFGVFLKGPLVVRRRAKREIRRQLLPRRSQPIAFEVIREVIPILLLGNRLLTFKVPLVFVACEVVTFLFVL
jgi:hypothetical protein